jgi:hypothetical protein
MLATKPQDHAKRALSYALVEAALAKVFGIDAAGQSGWLRGRIQHLRRLGLTPSTVRGPVAYSDEWLIKWLLALELEYFEVDPRQVVELIEKGWKPPHKRDASDAVQRGEATLSELVAVARAEKHDLIVTVQFGPMGKRPYVGCYFAGMPGESAFGGWLSDDSEPHRASCFSLSTRLRALDRAIDQVLREEAQPKPRVGKLAARILRAGRQRRRGE